MIDLYEARQAVNGMSGEMADLGKSLNLPELDARLKELEQQTTAPDFWNDQKTAQKVLKEETLLRSKQKRYNEVKSDLEDVEVMLELAEEGESDGELEGMLSAFQK